MFLKPSAAEQLRGIVALRHSPMRCWLENLGSLKFGLSEKRTKFEKKSSSYFGCLLSKCSKHEEDCANFCVLLRKFELYVSCSPHVFTKIE